MTLLRDIEKRRKESQRSVDFMATAIIVMLWSMVSSQNGSTAHAVIVLALLALVERQFLHHCRVVRHAQETLACFGRLSGFAKDSRLRGTPIGEMLNELIEAVR